MRARDFVEESKKQDHHGLHNPQLSGVHVMPTVDQGYEMYRLGLDMATAGGDDTKWPGKVAHPAADHTTVVAYSDGDHKIIGQVLKHRGIKHKDTSKGPSREDEHVHTVSPTAKRTKNRYGV
jgi:hypothetical protein